TDINVPVVALQRVVALMERIGAGCAVGPVVDVYPKARGPLTIHLRRERLRALLGVSVDGAEVQRILRGLGLIVTPPEDGWERIVPTFRVDLLREVDLIEEVPRHYGFEKLEPTFPVLTMSAPAPDHR